MLAVFSGLVDDGHLDTSLNLGALFLIRSTVWRVFIKNKWSRRALQSSSRPTCVASYRDRLYFEPVEAERLATPAYQDKMARAIRRGIQSWFARQPHPARCWPGSASKRQGSHHCRR